MRSPIRTLIGTVVVLTAFAAPAVAQDVSGLSSPDVHLQGSLAASTTSYTAANVDARRDPFSWLLNGNAALRVGSFSFPFSAVLSEQESSFRQPFNRYGISPTYRSWKVHLGYRSLNFSPYTLGGATFRGAALEAEPGPIRMAVMYGRFRRAVEEDTSSTRRSFPSYKRTGYGFKIGVGSAASFVDLILFKAADDTTSLESEPIRTMLDPAENAVAGLHTRLRLSQAVSVEAEVAGSAYTSDIRSPELESADDLPPILTGLLTPRLSSRFTLAYRGHLQVQRGQAQVRLQLERVAPGYETLGAYYFANDVQNITLAPTFDLLSGRLRLALSGGIQRDNLDGSKLATTRRVIGSVDVAWRPTTAFALNARVNNYSSGRRNDDVLVDSIRIEDVSRSISLMPRLTVPSGGLIHTISGGISGQEFRRRNILTDVASDSRLFSLRGTYGISSSEKGWSLGLTLSRTSSETGGAGIVLSGANVYASQSFLLQTLTVSTSFGLLGRSFDTDEGPSDLDETQTSFTADLDLAYRASPFNQFSVRSGYGNNPALPLEAQRSSELITTISYRRRFDFSP